MNLASDKWCLSYSTCYNLRNTLVLSPFFNLDLKKIEILLAVLIYGFHSPNSHIVMLGAEVVFCSVPDQIQGV